MAEPDGSTNAVEGAAEAGANPEAQAGTENEEVSLETSGENAPEGEPNDTEEKVDNGDKNSESVTAGDPTAGMKTIDNIAIESFSHKQKELAVISCAPTFTVSNVTTVKFNGCQGLLHIHLGEGVQKVHIVECNTVVSVTSTNPLKEFHAEQCSALDWQDLQAEVVVYDSCQGVRTVDCERHRSVTLRDCEQLWAVCARGSEVQLEELQVLATSKCPAAKDDAGRVCRPLEFMILENCSKLQKVSIKNYAQVNLMHLHACPKLAGWSDRPERILYLRVFECDQFVKFSGYVENLAVSHSNRAIICDDISGVSKVVAVERARSIQCPEAEVTVLERVETIDAREFRMGTDFERSSLMSVKVRDNQMLGLRECPRLQSIDGGGESSQLDSIDASGCGALQTITGCPKLTRIDASGTQLVKLDAPLLKSIMASNVTKLESISGVGSLPDLESLKIVGAPALAALPLMPAATRIIVQACPKLAGELMVASAKFLRVDDTKYTKVTADAALAVMVSQCANLTSITANTAVSILTNDCPALAEMYAKNAASVLVPAEPKKPNSLTNCVVSGINGSFEYFGSGTLDISGSPVMTLDAPYITDLVAVDCTQLSALRVGAGCRTINVAGCMKLPILAAPGADVTATGCSALHSVTANRLTTDALGALRHVSVKLYSDSIAKLSGLALLYLDQFTKESSGDLPAQLGMLHLGTLGMTVGFVMKAWTSLAVDHTDGVYDIRVAQCENLDSVYLGGQYGLLELMDCAKLQAVVCGGCQKRVIESCPQFDRVQSVLPMRVDIQ